MNMDDITSVGWNGQVSHILATSSTSGHTVVWDLRNRKEVMTLAYSGQSGGGISAGNRRGITTLAWHPDVVRFYCFYYLTLGALPMDIVY